MTTRTHTDTDEHQIAEQVADRLEHDSVEGRQPMPEVRRVSYAAFAAGLLVTAILLLVAGIQLGIIWTIIGGLAVAFALFLVVGSVVLGPAAMRSREEIKARREVEGQAGSPRVINK